MRRSYFVEPTRWNAGLLAGLLFAILTVPLGAQTARENSAGHPWLQEYNKASEITVDATVQEVVTHHIPRSPAGLHLIVSSSQGVFDAHLGPYMSKATIKSLHAGAPLQIVGAVETINGRSYLVAREVTFEGHTVIIRDERGLLLRQRTEHPAFEKGDDVESAGGAR